jgi:hypothetical protein
VIAIQFLRPPHEFLLIPLPNFSQIIVTIVLSELLIELVCLFLLETLLDSHSPRDVDEGPDESSG